jgi:glycine/D-amino acid oxidase-like deaminating enzyme
MSIAPAKQTDTELSLPRWGSLWLDQALEREPSEVEQLAGSVAADICIVGGGYLGLWTALRIKELDSTVSVAVVEADLAGAGASGRNGGFALSWWSKIDALIARVGHDEAVRLAKASDAAIDMIERFQTEARVDVDFRRGGWLWTATSPAQLDAWKKVVQRCEELGVDAFESLAPEEVRERTGADVNLAGILAPRCASIQPAFLARGLRRVAVAHGVRVFERSPMVRLDRDAGVVTTPGGAVKAGVVVLALNAWAARIRELRRAIVPVGSNIVATAPIPELLEEIGWTGDETISNSRLMVSYYRKSRDGRVVLGLAGGGLGFAGKLGGIMDRDARRTDRAARAVQKFVPVGPVPIEYRWGGAVDRTPDGLPIFGRLPARIPVLYGTGFSGNGVAPTVLGSWILASTALGRDDEWANSGLNRGVAGTFPPEPIRFLGGLIVRQAVDRKESREDRRQPVDPLTRTIAGLAPTGYFEVGS